MEEIQKAIDDMIKAVVDGTMELTVEQQLQLTQCNLLMMIYRKLDEQNRPLPGVNYSRRVY